ncbi:MAG TPA: zf-HC2 domain-containing protein, partial [Thermoanaerobaculia bacterium]|nr:zf-HC2 domain-containing protein [Thermoanaerobaculia bacterium]
MTDRHGERDLTAAVRDLAAALERGLGDHPAPGELLDFVAGDLSEAERERIEEHLALCRECARTALELAEPPGAEAAPAGELLTEKELAAEWRRFR